MPQCRVFAIDDHLQEIVADGLYGKHLFGRALSVAGRERRHVVSRERARADLRRVRREAGAMRPSAIEVGSIVAAPLNFT